MRKNIKWKVLGFACLGFVSIANLSSAQFTLVEDNFDRADGALTGTLPTPGPGSVWTNHSGTPGNLLISSGAAVVQHGVPDEDTHVSFPGQTTGILTATFDVSVSAGSPIPGSDNEYFAHFMTEGLFNFRSRLDIVAPSGLGDYSMGISSGSSTAESIFSTDFTYDTVYNVELAFDLDTGIGSATVGAETISGIDTFLGENLDSFALRQSDSDLNETITVDNLVVTTTVPEPSTYAAILGLLGLGFVMMRRRKA